MRRTIFLLTLALAACTSREDRVAERLERAGVRPKLARCMAPRLADDLSTAELRQLGDAAKGLRDADGRVRIDALAGRLGGVDPHIADVAARAAIGCAILG